jgi:hypothetical protein
VIGRLGISTALTALAVVSSTLAQNASPIASSTPASQSSSATSQHERSPQLFVCSKDYTVDSCYKDVAVLRRALAKYPNAEIGEWTWILVRSQDWKSIVMPRGLDPDSPAFTYSAKRETFIEEALVADLSGRKEELSARWHLRGDKLRELVIAHELGHAFCNDRSETVANQQAERLQDGKAPSCEPSLEVRSWRKKSALDPFHRSDSGASLSIK